jgi:hypothetical protein
VNRDQRAVSPLRVVSEEPVGAAGAEDHSIPRLMNQIGILLETSWLEGKEKSAISTRSIAVTDLAVQFVFAASGRFWRPVLYRMPPRGTTRSAETEIREKKHEIDNEWTN